MASAGNNEDVDDYMSDAVLTQCPDKRPGLVSGRSVRTHKQEARHKVLNAGNYKKPIKKVEAEKRDEGLKTAITSENRGFAILQRMGYKPGTALGKRGVGRSEPVPIQLKDGRGGLGQESEMKRKQADMEQMRVAMRAKRVKHEQRWQEDFRSRVISQQLDRRVESDLYSSQKVCAQLDSQKGIEKPSEAFFWPSNMLPAKPERNTEDEHDESGLYAYESEESDEEEEPEEIVDQFTASEKMEVLTMYLRNSYFYCIWCGTAYSDRGDLRSNCPGNTADAHD